MPRVPSARYSVHRSLRAKMKRSRPRPSGERPRGRFAAKFARPPRNEGSGPLRPHEPRERHASTGDDALGLHGGKPPGCGTSRCPASLNPQKLSGDNTPNRRRPTARTSATRATRHLRRRPRPRTTTRTPARGSSSRATSSRRRKRTTWRCATPRTRGRPSSTRTRRRAPSTTCGAASASRA